MDRLKKAKGSKIDCSRGLGTLKQMQHYYGPITLSNPNRVSMNKCAFAYCRGEGLRLCPHDRLPYGFSADEIFTEPHGLDLHVSTSSDDLERVSDEHA